MSEYNYYKYQLEKLTDLKHVTIKVTDYSGNSTNYLQLNEESLEHLIALVDRIKSFKEVPF